jgi:CubicO group peptidase (beta-lactamase class C family)
VVHCSRRAFMLIGAIASSKVLAHDRAGPAVTGMATDVANSPPGLQSLINQERERILEILKKNDIPGAAVCLHYQGKPLWIEGFGVTDRQSGRKVGTSTIFSIQSTSKNVTATAIMLAVQHGLLDLDKAITTYLPDFAVQSRFEQAPERKMTLRLLLSHRAGFTHEAPIGNNYDPAFPDFETHVKSISQTWLRYPVGERFAYSNLGIDLAGYILQTVSNMPFADCVKSLVFDPLGMSDSTASTDEYVDRADRAVGHAKGYTEVPLKIPLIPSGGVYTSARDMAAYLAFHLNKGKFDGKTILEEGLWREMHGFSLGGDYSLGVFRTELRYGDTPLRMLHHPGGGFGFGSVFRLFPQAELGWVALFNNRVADAGYGLGAELQSAILTRQCGEQRPRLPVQDLSAVDLPAAEMEKFIGNWRGWYFSGDIKFKDGELGMQVGPAFWPLKFSSPKDVFMQLPQGEALTAEYFPKSKGRTAYFLSPISERNLDYNDGPHDVPGPDRKEWDAYLGDYAIHVWGKLDQRVKVYQKNGYLYFDGHRLIVEEEPGLFFTCTGEAVDFRTGRVTVANIPLVRT